MLLQIYDKKENKGKTDNVSPCANQLWQDKRKKSTAGEYDKAVKEFQLFKTHIC
jgi:hypothetical protein